MTDDEINTAARELCKLRGHDPEGAAGWQHTEFGPRATVTHLSKAIEEVRAFVQIGTVLAIVGALPKASRKRASK